MDDVARHVSSLNHYPFMSNFIEETSFHVQKKNMIVLETIRVRYQTNVLFFSKVSCVDSVERTLTDSTKAFVSEKRTGNEI